MWFPVVYVGLLMGAWRLEPWGTKMDLAGLLKLSADLVLGVFAFGLLIERGRR